MLAKGYILDFYSDVFSLCVCVTKFQVIQNTMALVKNIKLRKNFTVSHNFEENKGCIYSHPQYNLQNLES